MNGYPCLRGRDGEGDSLDPLAVSELPWCDCTSAVVPPHELRELAQDSVVDSVLSSPSRARLQGSGQPLPEAVAVEKESVRRDANTSVRTDSSKPFSKAGATFLVTVFAGDEKVVRR
jgi:hypothetical protein